MKKQDNYGSFVDIYRDYTETPGGMEFVLGRKPALKALGNIRGKTVLNFGCGPGVNSMELVSKGARVIGIDISEEELQVARKLHPLGEYLHYDGVHLDRALQGRKIDAILASFSFCAIKEAALRPLLRDMRKLLPKGGKLVIADPNLEIAMGTEYSDLHYHAQPGVKSDDFVHVSLGIGSGVVQLYGDVYRTHVDYYRIFTEEGFKITAFKQPKPWFFNRRKWRKAREVPPFIIIIAE